MLQTNEIYTFLKYHRYFSDDLLKDRFYCQCGAEFYPDCSASSTSIYQALAKHQEEVVENHFANQFEDFIL